MITAADITVAFNQQNEKKGWNARANSRPHAGLDLVHFTGPSSLISLTYNALDGTFAVRFEKVHAAWGDYIKSIAKAMYYVLTVLKSAGLPFDAPEGPAGIRIIATANEDNTVHVEWPGMHGPTGFLMRPVDMSPTLSFSLDPETGEFGAGVLS